MNYELIRSLIDNTALLLSLCIIYTLLPIKKVKYSTIRGFFIGCIIGVIGIGIMSSSYELMNGVTFDTRSILVSVTAMFLGLIPTIITAILLSIFRIYQGGIGILTGILSIVSSAVIGLAWNYFRIEKITLKRSLGWIELYFIGIMIHISMLLCMLTLPEPLSKVVLKNISVPVMIIYPIGTVLLSVLLLNQREHNKTQLMIEESEELYRSLFENNYAVMLLMDPKEGNIIDANQSACNYYGWTLEEIQKMKISDINILPLDKVNEEIKEAGDLKRNYFIFKHKLSTGVIRDVEVYSGPIQVKGEKFIYSIIHDITERKLAENRLIESEERLKVTLLSIGDGVIATDKFGRINIVNKMVEEITGWTKEEMIGKPINDIFKIINEYTREKVEDPVQKVFDTGNIVGLANHTILICKDDIEKPIADSAAPINDGDGNIQGVVLVIRDATEERKKQNEIYYLGYHDSLTGLYNRRYFEETLINIDDENKLPISIIMGDVNGLKLTNDAFGHKMGDDLLKKMASCIKNACRETDVVSRWGGDEFIVLLPNTSSAQTEKICKEIKDNCSKVNIDGVNFSISLGFETKNNIHEEITNIIKKAEDYMYRDKSVESSSMRSNAIKTILLTLHEKNLRERLHSNRVSELCEDIGRAMKFSPKEIRDLSLAGLMHDIGKITISDEILNKEGKLSYEEWSQVKKHPLVGYRILSASNSLSYIAEYVLAHHEKLDGSGYPSGSDENEIPIQSKIIAVADAFDAMTSIRTYRNTLTTSEAIEEIKKYSGTQFDPKIVEIFIEKVLLK